MALGWFQLVTSMIEERTHMCKDLNLQQIVPNVYVFNSPVSGEMLHSFFEDPFSGGGRVYGPEKFVETFHEKSITVVAQLDKVTYDTSVFTGRFRAAGGQVQCEVVVQVVRGCSTLHSSEAAAS